MTSWEQAVACPVGGDSSLYTRKEVQIGGPYQSRKALCLHLPYYSSSLGIRGHKTTRIYQKDSITRASSSSPSKAAFFVPAEDLQMNTSVEEEAWPVCKGQFVYLKADDLARWPTNRSVEPLTAARPKSLEVFNSFQLSPKEEGDPEVVMDCLEGRRRPRHSEAYERFLFRTRFQELCEPFEDFVADLLYKSHFCNFGEQREPMVRDQVIVGCRDSLVRQRLVDHDNLGLEEALRICRWAEEKQPQHPEDSCRHPSTSSDEKTLFQKEGVKDKKHWITRRKARRVRKMAKKLNQWPQDGDDRPRKESFKTYV